MKRFAKLYQGTDGFCQVKERENGEYVLYDEANARIAELEAMLEKSKEMMRKARKDILETARANQQRLTGLDFVTGDTGCPPVEIHQRGIDESLLICDEINDLFYELPPMQGKE